MSPPSIRPMILVLALALAGPALAAGPSPPPVPEVAPPPLPALPVVPRAPIVIAGDDAFTAENGVVGGSGTASDPYRIEGWLILGGGPEAAIDLQGTTAHVLLRGNFLYQPREDTYQKVCTSRTSCQSVVVPRPGDLGLRVIGASNVRFEGNLVAGFPFGVVLQSSRDVTLRSSIFDPHWLAATVASATADPLGWARANVPRFTVSAEAREGQWTGLVATDVKGLSVEDVEFRGYPLYGADLFAVDGSFEDSVFTGSTLGFRVDGGAVITFRGNDVSRNGQGWYVCGGGTVATIVGNTIEKNLGDSHGYAVHVSENAPYCTGGITWAHVVGNTMRGNHAGVLAIAHVEIRDNVIEDHDWYGVYQQFIPVTIRANTFRNNTDGVILRQLFRHADGVTLAEGNEFEKNVRGAYVIGPVKPLLAGNSFEASERYGVVNTDGWVYVPDPSPATTPVDARGNWWGSADGPGKAGADGVFGAAHVAPWLTSKP